MVARWNDRFASNRPHMSNLTSVVCCVSIAFIVIEMNNSNSNMTTLSSVPANVVIKSESGLMTPGRLSSFKQPRDLMLSNSTTAKQPPKKVFTPNLNVVRNKNKNLLIVDHNKTKRKNEKYDKAERLRSHQNKGSSVVKSTGVFSEGIAAGPRRYNTRESCSSGNSRDSSSVLEKPVYKARIEPKVEKDFEGMKIKNLSSDEDSEDDPMDSQLLPIKLPMNIQGLHLPRRSNKPLMPKPSIKQEAIIKTEPTDDILSKDPPISETVDNHKVKTETFEAKDVIGCFQNPKSSLFMLQFPDSLPGRGPDTVSDTKEKTENTEQEPEAPNLCTFSNLEEGQIGKILVYKSGNIKMIIGNTHYDLSLDSQGHFKQDVMSISVNPEERTGTMINLGDIHAKLTAIPDWEKMCENKL